MNTQLSKIKTELAFINLAQQSGRQFWLTSKNEKAADRLLLFMLAQHGTQLLARFAGTNFQQIQPALARLKKSNMANTDGLPDFSKDGCKRALSVLTGIQRTTGLIEAADYRVLQKTAFEQIDSLPAFGKFQTAAAEIYARLPVLQRLFSFSNSEHLDPESNLTARKNAREIQKALAEIQPGDLLAAKDMIVEMKKIMPAIKDQEIGRQLQLRIKTYEGALELFGGKLHANLRNILSEVLMKDSLEIASFANIFAGDNFAVSSLTAAAEALIALASSAPLAVAGIVVAPGASFTAHELTREGRQWLELSQEERLVAELNRGIEYFDEKLGRMQRFILPELAGSYSRQYAIDLARALSCMGASQLLAKAIGKMGPAHFVTLLNSRGAGFALLSIGFQKADSIASQGQNSGFVQEYFKELSRHSDFSNTDETNEDIVIALMEGEYDKTAPLLASLARCALSGVTYIPKSKFSEFAPKSGDLASAPKLLDLQLSQLYNDGYTLRMKSGARFDAIDARGRVTEFRPSPELSGHLQDYKAPDWVTNTRARAGIEQIQLGELKKSLLMPLTQAQQQEKLAANFEQDERISSSNSELLAAIKQFMPEISGEAVTDFKRRLQERQNYWIEDLERDSRCLRQIDPELQDSAVILAETRERYFSDENLHNEAQQELSHQKGWFRKPLSERLTSIEHKIVDKVEALEHNPEHPLGRAKQEYDRLRQEHDSLKLKLEKLTNERRGDLQNLLDYMHDKHAWTRVVLECRQDLATARESYQFGSGKIILPWESLFKSGKLDLTIFHEIVHSIQDRALAEYSLYKMNSIQNQAKLFYEKLTGWQSSDEFLAQTAAKQVKKVWQGSDELRLLKFAEDLKKRQANLSAESEKLYLRLAFLEGRLYSLNRDKAGKGLDYLFNHFNSEADGENFQRRLFDRFLPLEVQDAYEQWNSSRQGAAVFKKEEAKRKVKEALEEEIEHLRKEYADLALSNYYDDRLEAEAEAAESDEYYWRWAGQASCSPDGGLAGGKRSAAAAAVTPYEAMQVLTAASAKKGDSLHAESRGWEATRKMYDSKLQQGIMSPAQLKQILGLSPADREAIETMLKHDSLSLTKEVLAKLLQLESNAFHNLLGVPPTICNRVLVPAIERGLMDARRLDQILNLADTQRRVAMDFIEKAVKDPHHAFSSMHVERFMALPPAGRVDIAQTMTPTESSRALSTSETALALSAPTRTSGGKEFCDAAALVKALQRGILLAEQVKDFAKLDENARGGISALLGTNALTKETSALLIQKLQSGELSEVNARDLGVARLVGWLPDGTLEQVLKLDAALRHTLFDRLAAETPRGKQGGFSVPDFIKRQTPLNEMRKQGVINEPTMRLLSTQHASDLLVFALLNSEAIKPVSERVSPESIQQMILLSRAGKINLETLEAYRLGIEMTWLDRNTLKSLLSQKPEIRQAAETFLRLDPEMFLSLLQEGRYDTMSSHAEELLNPARAVFPEMFPEDGKLILSKPVGLENSRDLSKILNEFMEQMNRGELEGALCTIVENESTKKTEFRFVEKRISLYDLNRVQILQSLSSLIQRQGRAVGETVDADPRNEDHVIMSADPIIELVGNREFRLRDSELICENGDWRETSAPEKTFIESIQNSEAGKAVLGTTAMVLMTAWAQKATHDRLQASILHPESAPELDEGEDEDQILAAEAEAAAKAADFVPSVVSVRSLTPGNFAGISRGYAEMTFASGKKAAVEMPAEKFKAIEEAYNQYISALARASKLEGEARERRMAELAWYFDMEFASALLWAGIRLGYASQPYMKPLFDIRLFSHYKPKAHSDRAPAKSIDLNTEQGLRRYLKEHEKGKQLYQELASIKRSGITPKFDPKPPSGRAAKINPQDLRILTSQQRSAVAQAILNDSTGSHEGIYKQPESGLLDAVLEITVFKFGDGVVSHSAAAFNRAEEWTYLLIALNDKKPISQGGKRVQELYDAGEFKDLPVSKELLLSSNDFMQTLRELGVSPDDSLWDAPGHYRVEVDERLAAERPDAADQALRDKRARRAGVLPEPPLHFERGESVKYNDEAYRLIGREPKRKQALIMYDGLTREPAPAVLVPVSDAELQSAYREILKDNKIHYVSKDNSDSRVFVLSIDELGERTLHTDSFLRFLPAKQVSALKPGEDSGDDMDRTLAIELAQKAREIFDKYKEYSLGVSGQQRPLPFRQVVLGRGNDAGIKIMDEANYVGTRHLQVLVSGNSVAVQDLNSKNGSFLNGRRMQPYETVNLRTTDRVTLGATDGPVMALIYKPTEISTAPEYRYFVGDKLLMPGAAPLIIGRLATADAFVSDPTVSKIQATIYMTVDGKVMIKDGGAKPSLNGLVINGEQVIPGSEVELNPGDKVATKTGVILPIIYEKKRSRFALLAETGSGRVNIKDANLAGIPVFLGVDPRHGVYALPKSNDSWLTKRSNKYTGGKAFKIKPVKKQTSNGSYEEDDLLAPDDTTAAVHGILSARRRMSEAALKQSNHFALLHSFEPRMEDGWSSVGRGKTFDSDSNFEAVNRIATTVDRTRDPILRGVLEDSRRRFWHLSPELRARALTEYARDLLTPAQMTPEQLDQWYNQFSHDHDSKRVLLGEFIKEGKGICSQQAILVKALADEFDDMHCKLVRGLDGCHTWTTFMLSGREIIHDPRGRFISPVAGEKGALPHAIHWLPDTETGNGELAKQTYVKVGDSVSYDGTSAWKVSSYDTLSGEIVLSANGNRSVYSADLALANPGRTLIRGEKYNIPREDGLLDRGLDAWTLESINKDGTLKFFKAAAIEVQARLDQVRLRAERLHQ